MEKSHRRRGRGRALRARTGLSAGVALVSLVMAIPAAGGCNCSNRLPPNPVPGPDGPPDLPPWFPEEPWNAAGSDSRIYIEGKIVFHVDRATIRPESEAVLEKFLKFIQEHPEVTRVRIEGHTDSTASDEYNQELSARRSLAVANWLVDRGIESNRLLAVGFGESRPIAPNELAAGRQENRRTEFHVAEVDGVPFGGKDPTNGGLALEVLSLEERAKLAEEKNAPPPPKFPPFDPTGDEIKAIKETPRGEVEGQAIDPDGGDEG